MCRYVQHFRTFKTVKTELHSLAMLLENQPVIYKQLQSVQFCKLKSNEVLQFICVFINQDDKNSQGIMYSKLERSLNQNVSLFFLCEHVKLGSTETQKEEEKGRIIKVIKKTRRAVELNLNMREKSSEWRMRCTGEWRCV